MREVTKLPLTAYDFKVYKTGDQSRLRDVRFGQRLGFERPDDIRKLIIRNRSDLEDLDNLLHRVANYPGAGRPATEFFITLRQAFLLAAISEALNAKAALKELCIIGAARYTGEPIAPDATPILDKIAVPAAQPTIEHDNNVIRVRHEEWPTRGDWTQGELFKLAPVGAPKRARPRHMRLVENPLDPSDAPVFKSISDYMDADAPMPAATTRREAWHEDYNGISYLVAVRYVRDKPWWMRIMLAGSNRYSKRKCGFVPEIPNFPQSMLTFDHDRTPRPVIDAVLARCGIDPNHPDVKNTLDGWFK